MEDRKVNYKCLFLAFGVLTVVYLLSEYALYQVDLLLDEILDPAPVQINIYIDNHNNDDGDSSPGQDEDEGVEVNSTIIDKLLGALLREKRQSTIPIIPGYVCAADLFRKVDLCCPTPVFISENELMNCQRRRFARSAEDSENATESGEIAAADLLRNLSQSEIELGYDGGADELYDLKQELEVEKEKNESNSDRPPPPSAPGFYFRWSPMRIIQMPQRRYYSNNNRMQRAQSQRETFT